MLKKSNNTHNTLQTSDGQTQEEQQQLSQPQEVQDKTGRTSKPQSQPHSGDKKIILSGHIAKRHPYFIFFQTRLLVLSEVSGEPYLRYYKPYNNELRVILTLLLFIQFIKQREFPLIPTTFAEIDGPNKFTITTATEKYNFKVSLP